jgi:hypothetical protein
VRAFGQQQRADPAAEEGAGGEAEQGQGADDQALAVAPEGEGEGEGQDCPVQDSHPLNRSMPGGPPLPFAGEFISE